MDRPGRRRIAFRATISILMLALVHGLATLYAVAADTSVHGSGAIASVVGHQW